jgi:rod shape-determining protein MreB
VAVDRATRKVLADGRAVGHLARQLQGRTADSIEVVQPLQAGAIADFGLCEAMLRYFLRKLGRVRWWAKPRVLVSVPGCITPVEKQAVLQSVERAGARRVMLVDSARAAAIGVGLPLAEPVASMICELGGGTTNVAVFSLGEQVAGQSLRIGGEQLNRAIVDYLRRELGLRVGLAAAETLRLTLGSAAPQTIEPTAEIAGIDLATGVPRKQPIGGEQLRDAMADPLRTILEAIRQTLDQTPIDLAAELIDNGMTLCGGGVLLPGLDIAIQHATGIPSIRAHEPSTASVNGALLCLKYLDRFRVGLEMGEAA